MTVTVPTSTVSLILDPTSSPFATQDINITVGTNNKSGYWMTMASSTGSSDLVNTDDSTKTIPTLTTAGDYDSSSFEVNKWGYKVNNGNYTPFVSGNIIHQTNTTTNGETVKLTLGSKIDYMQSPGTYNIALTIKALPIMTTNYIQNLDPAMCTEDPMVVVDSRDEQAYTIQRLKDGKCWMMDNLNLGASALSVSQLDSTNTNITNGSTISASDWGSYKKTSGTSDFFFPEYVPLNSSTSSNGLSSDATSDTLYGTLYNYCAASAGTICTTINPANATSDICPAGWRLPTGGSSGEFQNLYSQSAYNANTKMRASVRNDGAAFAMSGFFYNDAPTAQGNQGDWWSSTRYDNNHMYDLTINTSDVYTTTHYSGLIAGVSVRCVLRDTMQEFSSANAATMSVGDTRTLTDSRDGQAYTIRKLPDNNVWMVQNLRYVGDTGSTSTSMIMKADTSNISTDQNLTIGDLTSGNDYNNARIHVATSDQVPSGASYTATDMGVWYNYAAASAGYVTSNQHSTVESAESVCPKNWHLPTDSEMSGITSYQSAFFNGGSGITGGHYNGGSVLNTGRGYWWSSTPYPSSSNDRYLLYYDGSSLNTGNSYRYIGFYVRCIKN